MTRKRFLQGAAATASLWCGMRVAGEVRAILVTKETYGDFDLSFDMNYLWELSRFVLSRDAPPSKLTDAL